jgi:hypothetical protein
MFSRRVALLLLSMLAMVALGAVPAFAQQGQNPDQVRVTFKLTIDGEVPEGRTVSLNFVPQNESGGFEDIFASFCSTSNSAGPALPRCEDGATYTATFFSIGGGEPFTGPFSAPAGQPLSYEYTVGSNVALLETIASDTITPTKDTTVNVTYRPGGQTTSPDKENICFLPEGCDTNDDGKVDVGAGGTVAGDQYDENEQSVTSDQYVEGEQSVNPDSSGPIGILPDTGGASLLVGLVGALLVGGGLFVRRLLG